MSENHSAYLLTDLVTLSTLTSSTQSWGNVLASFSSVQMCGGVEFFELIVLLVGYIVPLSRYIVSAFIALVVCMGLWHRGIGDHRVETMKSVGIIRDYFRI